MLYNTGRPASSSVIIQRGGMGEGKEAQEGGDICIIMPDSCCCCMAESNTTLQSSFPPIKKNLFFLGRCLGHSLCKGQGGVGLNSLPPWCMITESPCRSYRLFVRSIVISLDTKFASVSSLVTRKRHPYAISKYGTSCGSFTVCILSTGAGHAGPYYLSVQRGGLCLAPSHNSGATCLTEHLPSCGPKDQLVFPSLYVQ